jgi:dimethylhistidine N-methyltransferase
MGSAEPIPVELVDLHPRASDMRADLLAGLASEPKRFSPKYFYDEQGSRLFDAICRLPEYYLTRTEVEILQTRMEEIAECVGPGVRLVEFGSGSSTKTRMLLERLRELATYVPVDISRDHLLATAEELARDYPGLEVQPLCADFTQDFDLPRMHRLARRNVVFFPGSTIGNFSPDQAHALLTTMAHIAGPQGGVLIGIDMKKDEDVLTAAYNDSAGITSQFNLNMLARFNRELGADFDLGSYRHRALYNSHEGRIEMYLVSLRKQRVTVSGKQFDIAEGEAILTECSHKYDQSQFSDMASAAGLEARRAWSDRAGLFSVQYLETRDAP